MPIQFAQPTPQGVPVNYNVVDHIGYNPTSDTSDVRLVAYYDKSAFDAGSSSFPGQGFTIPGQPSVSDAEQYIIALPEWSGATIVE